jgi:hypothetical protein
VANQKSIIQTLQEVIITTAFIVGQYFWNAGEWRLCAWGVFERGQVEFILHQRVDAR